VQSDTDFAAADLDARWILKAFTIVSFAAPGMPYVAGVIDSGGTSIRDNIINVNPDPDHVKLGMKVKLVTYSIGTGDDGTEAMGFDFGFEPS
jgi:uncharacterized OB-fold protein